MFRRCALVLAILLIPIAASAATVGKPAPSFVITTYDGEKISLESLRGKVVIVNYWATWCAPCRLELPQMDVYVRRHRTAPLAVYAITIDNTVPYSRLKFLGDTLAFPLTQKLKGGGYGAIRGAVPTNYVIDRAGIVRHAKAGAFTLADLERLVTPLLVEQPPLTVAAAAP